MFGPYLDLTLDGPSMNSFMDGCVGAGEAAYTAETRVNVRKTCTCMHKLRVTSGPHGHHGPAHRAGGQVRCSVCL